MTQNELVETIIKEVKRVLALRGIPVAPPADGKKPSVTSYGIGSQESSEPVSQTVTESKVGSHDMTGKQVITRKDLHGFHGTSLQVSQNAVVTPLAVDYAREKGITITRTTGIVVKPIGPVPVLAISAVALAVAPDFPGDRSIIDAILKAKGFRVKEFSEKSYDVAVRKLASAIAAGSVLFGLCVEKSGMEGPIHANRHTKIRAVNCRTAIEARAARVDIGANVIVIDMSSDPDEVISGFIGQ
jgi:ribose 5-phosphate isomerase RpiB